MNERLKKILAKKSELLDEADGVLALCDSEERDLSEDEESRLAEIKGQVSRLKTREDAERALIEEERTKVAVIPDVNRQTTDEIGGGDEPQFADISQIRIPMQAHRYASRRMQCFKGPDAEAKAYAFGMLLGSALGNKTAMKWCIDRGFNFEAVYNESTNTQGGYLVFPEIDRDIIDLVETFGQFRANARPAPMTSDVKQRPRRTGGLTAYFVTESEAGTESTGSWDMIELHAKDLMVLTRETNQLMDDAIISTADQIAREMARAIAEKEDDCGFNGTGTSTYGGIVGVCRRLIDINGVDDGGGVVLGAGNLFTEITLANLNSMTSILPLYAEAGAAWYMSKLVYGQTVERLISAAGGNTWNILATGGPRRECLGYPIILCTKMPKTNANSQIIALFGDLSLAADFGDRKQLSIAMSDSASVGGESVFERNQIAIRATSRFDINVHDVGTATAAGPIVGLISAAA
jgi:HK97 family phage major capsid protein